MPTILGPRFPPSFSGLPARMSPEDYDIWLRWWPTAREDALALYFDVGLGLPHELPASDDAAMLLGWIRLNQKRADVVIERERKIELVELRFNASANAIGRLLTYLVLFRDDNRFGKPATASLVTNREDGEVRRIANLSGLDFFVA